MCVVARGVRLAVGEGRELDELGAGHEPGAGHAGLREADFAPEAVVLGDPRGQDALEERLRGLRAGFVRFCWAPRTLLALVEQDGVVGRVEDEQVGSR